MHVSYEIWNFKGSAALKREPTVIACVLDCLEDVLVVEFTCAGLISSRVVCDVEVPYHVDVLGDIADNITLGNLLMIDIEEELAVLAVDSLELSYCFFGCY